MLIATPYSSSAHERDRLGLVELELELIQPHMAQKPVLRGEVGCVCVAREVGVERVTWKGRVMCGNLG